MDNSTKKKYLGKWDYLLGVICGALVVYFFVIPIFCLDSDHFRDYFECGGLLSLMPIGVLLAISVLYVRRYMSEWKDKDDQIAPVVMAFLGCTLRFLLLGAVWPISIWFTSSGTFSRPYTHINRKSVLDALAKVSSTSDISNAFALFPSKDEGYECCKKWLKKQTRKNFTDKVRAVFVAYCFGDKEFCDSHFYPDGWVCNKKRAAQLLELFCHNGDDSKVVAFIKRYTNSSDEARMAYAKEILWNKYVDNNDEVAYRFYMSLGIKPRYIDSYSYRRRKDHCFLAESSLEDMVGHRASFWSGGWQCEEYETNLSRAVEKNDINTVEKLLKWGCDPNQYLKIEAESPTIQPTMLDLLGHDIVDRLTLEGGVRSGVVKSNHVIESNHIINLVTSRAMFYLLISAGMDRNPPTSISYVNGERKVSDTTDECKFS